VSKTLSDDVQSRFVVSESALAISIWVDHPFSHRSNTKPKFSSYRGYKEALCTITKPESQQYKNTIIFKNRISSFCCCSSWGWLSIAVIW